MVKRMSVTCMAFQNRANAMIEKRLKPLGPGALFNSTIIVQQLSDDENTHYLDCEKCQKFVSNKDED
jgi:hypothetical protein